MVNVRVPKFPGSTINAASTEIIFPERLMYAADGVIAVTVNGHTIVGYATSTFVLITTVCVEVAAVMFTRPAGVV